MGIQNQILNKKYKITGILGQRRENKTLVITTHGFIKKTQKTPRHEIAKAEQIRIEYFIDKKKEKK